MDKEKKYRPMRANKEIVIINTNKQVNKLISK